MTGNGDVAKDGLDQRFQPLLLEKAKKPVVIFRSEFLTT